MKRLEEIKKSVNEIEDYHPEERWEVLMDDVPALVAALEAVLELHEPEATGYGDWVCGACISAGSHDWESTAYPCPTVQAIHQALGEGEQ